MSLIYEPKGKAREYSALALNVYNGCGHGCIYCYAPAACQKEPKGFWANPAPRKDFIRLLEREINTIRRSDAELFREAKPKDRVLLCFTCDPYQPLNNKLGHTAEAIKLLHLAGYPIQILTKGGSQALRDLNLFRPGDAFATTLTFLDPGLSRKWELGAALPEDRIETIKAFHGAGVETWVSLEPVLDPEASIEIIRQTHPFVDLFKVGRWNHSVEATRIDWKSFGERAVALLKNLNKPYYIKDDLKAFL